MSNRTKENYIFDSDFIVNDSVISDDICNKIIDFFSSNKIPDPLTNSYSNFFNRSKRDIVNLVENIIDDYLKKIGDDSNVVEYWYRTEWLNLPCHKDMNEELIEFDDNISIAKNGHILYLSEINKESGTIIFTNDEKKIGIIYPKKGRIVRFNGDNFHYVPSPFHYIFGNDSINEYKLPRIALLFNTWNIFKEEKKTMRIISPYDNNLLMNPVSDWIKLPLFQIVKIKDPIELRIEYMAESFRRFNKNKNVKILADKRIKTDGYSDRLIVYDILEKLK